MPQPESQVEDVNIEEVMLEIRKQLKARSEKFTAGETSIVELRSGRLPRAFYEHLHGASISYDQIQARMLVSKSSAPFIGPLVQSLRRKVHELVLFYVNQVAANQIRVNHHLIEALTIIGEELERDSDAE